MAEPRRNTPCPCGSGLKYKRCCAQGFTDDDAERGLEALVRLVGTWQGVSEVPWEAFYGPQGRPPGPHSIEDDVYLDWLYFDVRNNRGSRLVDLLLRTKGLPRGVRAYAAAMRDSALRLYEVNEHRRGRQAVLRDVLSGKTHVLAGGVDGSVALLAARVVTRGVSGGAELVGPGLSFPGFLRAELVGLLRDELAALRHAAGDTAGDEWKALAPILYRRWCSYVHAPPAPASAPTAATNDAAREPPPPRPDTSSRERRTEEQVFDLPGTIDIRVLRALQEAKFGAVSGEQIHRCLVRGYRRRANPGWKDQQERFVKPYWRGPEDGPIVERPYRLIP